jgi:hypothetical protein
VEQFADSFALASEPQAIATTLVADEPEFAHLGLARLACVFSERALFLHGGSCAALIAVPTYMQGPLRHLVGWLISQFVTPLFAGEDPDFLILIDRPFWDSLDAERRERLIYHELCHVEARETEHGTPRLDQEGRPMLKLKPHDSEVFHAELERYGVTVTDQEALALAIVEGERRRRARTPRSA